MTEKHKIALRCILETPDKIEEKPVTYFIQPFEVLYFEQIKTVICILKSN